MRFTDKSHNRTRSDRGKRVQGWYTSRKWRRLSRECLEANPLCQCPHCTSGNMEPKPATVVDHIKPHKGDRRLFWDVSNLQSLAASCHNGPKQSQECGGHGFMKGCDGKGYPLHPGHRWHEVR